MEIAAFNNQKDKWDRKLPAYVWRKCEICKRRHLVRFTFFECCCCCGELMFTIYNYNSSNFKVLCA